MEVSYGTIIIIIIFFFVSTWSLCTHSHIVAQYGGGVEAMGGPRIVSARQLLVDTVNV